MLALAAGPAQAVPAQGASPLCFTTSVEVQLTDSCEVLANTLGSNYTAVNPNIGGEQESLCALYCCNND